MTAAFVLAVLQILDSITTIKAIDLGASERNKILARLFGKFEIRRVLIAKSLLVSAIGFAIAYVGYEPVVWALCAWYLVVVLNNINVIRNA